MSRLARRAVAASAARPRLVLVLWLAVVVAGAAFAVRLDGALTAGGFEDPRSESAAAQSLLEQDFGAEPNTVLVTLSRDDAAVPAADVDGAASVLRAHGATTVRTPADVAALGSADGRTVVLVAGFDAENTAVQRATTALQEGLDAAVASRAEVTGQPALDYELNVDSKRDATRAEMIVFPVLVIVLLLVFRSVAAAAVPLVLAGSALAVANGIGYLLSRATDISILYSNIVSMVGLAVAVDYSLFIVKRYREELSAGRDVPAAIRVAYDTAGRSVLFSGLAVTVALAGLLIPRLMAFTSIALGGIVVTVVSIVLTMTALPAILALLGTRIGWGRVPLPARTRRRDPRRPSIAAGLVAAGVMLVCALPVLGLSLQSPVASATVLPAGSTARAGLERAREALPDADLFPVEVVVEAPAGSVDGVLATVGRVAAVAAEGDAADVTAVTTLGLAGPALETALAASPAPAELAALWARTGDRVATRVLVAPAAAPDTVAAHELVERLRAVDADAGVQVHVTGATARGLDFDDALVRSLPGIVLFVFALTFVMLAAAFRSALIPLLAVAFNALVVGASLGLLTWITERVSGGPLNSVTPVLLFAVMFGLSMDYMVIMIARILEAYRDGLDWDAAIAFGSARTRAMVNSAAAIMIAVFASFGTAQISIVREIGIGLGLAVALDALVIRSLVMPAVLRLVGERAVPRGVRRARAGGPATARHAAVEPVMQQSMPTHETLATTLSGNHGGEGGAS